MWTPAGSDELTGGRMMNTVIVLERGGPIHLDKEFQGTIYTEP
jgi:hypothetical protein